MDTVFKLTKKDSKILAIEKQYELILGTKYNMDESNLKNSKLFESNYIIGYKNNSFSEKYNILNINNVVEISKNKKILETKKNRKFEKIFYLLVLLIIINLFNPIVSDHSISLTLKGPCNNEPIFNWKSFTKPSKIFLSDSLVNNAYYNYNDDYLKFNCYSDKCEIKLLWDKKALPVQSNQVIISDIVHNVISTIYIDELPSKAEKMFQNCNKILSIDLSYFKSDEIKTMANMFDSCTSLTTINGLSLKNVYDLSYLFSDCISLTSVTFMDIDTNPSEFDILANSMFQNC